VKKSQNPRDNVQNLDKNGINVTAQLFFS